MRASGAPNSAMPTPNQAAEPAAADEREGEDRAEHPACADGRVEDADARVARVEEVDRDHDGEDDEAAAGERLDDAEPGDQRERAVGLDGGEALEHRAPAAADLLRTWRRVVREGDDDERAVNDAAAQAANTAPGRPRRAGRPR